MMPQLPETANMPDLPLALSLLIAFLLLSGSAVTFIGALGLACFRNFYDRLHMPALGTTIGATTILIATSLYTSYFAGHIILRDILPVLFLFVTAPINIMMLARPATMRDLTQNWRDTSSHTIFRELVTDKTDEQVEKDEEKEEKERARAYARAQKGRRQPAKARKSAGAKKAKTGRQKSSRR